MSDIVDPINQMITSSQNALSFIDSIFNKIDDFNHRKISKENYLRAYYLEVISNIEILSCLNIDKIKTFRINDKIFQQFINKLQTQIGFTLLFSEDKDKTDIFNFLKFKGKIDNRNNQIIKLINGKEVIGKNKIIYENVLQAVSFTVIKTEFLKQMSKVTDEEIELYNQIQIDKRIINIKERFIMIKNIMSKLDCIKDLAR
jgi:hypothetical protein